MATDLEQRTWFYIRERKKIGPVPWTNLRDLAASGQLHSADMVLPNGATQWVQALSIAGLFPLPNPPASPGPPPLPAVVTVSLPANQPSTVAAAPPYSLAALAQRSGAAPTLPIIPGYTIEGELGRGGMGVVYKARQVKADRPVALKMILAGAHAGEQGVARFRVEAESVARLQHPNIVQVFEVGEHDGLPFFSLEFCPGGSLDRKLAGTPLPPKEAAALVELLARAMQEAHNRGVIHRDLKPANVLLAEDGTPKVTDFGLAKQLGGSGQTQSGAILGTPSYMAPEQASGNSKDVGPATDVYALGAILYECLTGRPPFRAARPLDTILLVVSEEPVPPCRLAPNVPRDLETITLKCLQKSPGRRYPTAGTLADELRSFLDDRPITARPAGWPERAWRWCKRNRTAAAAAGSAALFLILGAAVSAVLAVKAMHSAERAETRERQVLQEQEKTNSALSAEARRRRQARQALDVLTDSAIDDLLTRKAELTPGQRSFLEKVLKLQQEFADDVPEDSDAQQTTADGQLKVAALQQRLGRLPEAEQAYRKAIGLYQRLEGDGPIGKLARSRQAAAWDNLGNVLREAGRAKEAEDAFRRSLQLYGERGATGPALPVDAMRARMNQAMERELAGDLEGAKTGYREVLATLAPEKAGPVVSLEVLELTAKTRSNLGSTLITDRHPAEAVEELRKAITAFRQLQQQAPAADHTSGLAKAIHNLGRALDGLGESAEAAKMYREAVEVEEKLADTYPGVPEYRADLANHLNLLANSLRASAKRSEAEAIYRRAVAAAVRATKDRPRALAWREQELDFRENLATFLAEDGRLAEAESTERDLLVRRQALAADFAMVLYLPLRTAASRNNLTRMLLDQGHLDKAVLEAGLTIHLLDEAAKSGVAGTSGLLAQALSRRAEALTGLRQFDAALKDCERGLQLPIDRSHRWLTFYRACSLARLGKPEEASSTLDGLTTTGPVPAALAADAARVYALAAGATKDVARRDLLAGKAVAFLRRALQTASFRDAARRAALLQDEELSALRARQDFKELK